MLLSQINLGEILLILLALIIEDVLEDHPIWFLEYQRSVKSQGFSPLTQVPALYIPDQKCRNIHL